MKITHFDPLSFVTQLHRDFDRIGPRTGRSKTLPETTAEWTPAVDIIEDQAQFLLRADVPGVATSDIDVSMDAGVLTISGVRPAISHDDETATQRVERSTGRFERRFTLPETADAEGIAARNSNGVLEVSIPKLPEIQARRITVEAA